MLEEKLDRNGDRKSLRPGDLDSATTNKQGANAVNRGETDEKKETWKGEIQTGDTKGRPGWWHHMGQMSKPPTLSHELLLTGVELQSCPASFQSALHFDKRVTDGRPIKASSGPVRYRWSQTQQCSPHPSPYHPFVCTIDLIWSLRFAALEGWNADWKAENAERGHICVPTCLESAHILSEGQWESLFTARCQTVESRNPFLLARELFCALFLFRLHSHCFMETFHSKYPGIASTWSEEWGCGTRKD